MREMFEEEEDYVATTAVDDVSAAVQASLQEQWTQPTKMR